MYVLILPIREVKVHPMILHLVRSSLWIHPAGRRGVAGVHSDNGDDKLARMTSTHCESRRFSIRLPRPLWVGAVALVLIVVAFGISFGVPIYRQQAARREIGRLGGRLEEKYHGPQWLRRLLGYDRTRVFDVINVVRLGGTDFGDGDMQFLIGLGSVEHVVLYDTKVTDSALVHLRTLGRLKRL